MATASCEWHVVSSPDEWRFEAMHNVGIPFASETRAIPKRRPESLHFIEEVNHAADNFHRYDCLACIASQNFCLEAALSVPPALRDN